MPVAQKPLPTALERRSCCLQYRSPSPASRWSLTWTESRLRLLPHFRMIPELRLLFLPGRVRSLGRSRHTGSSTAPCSRPWPLSCRAWNSQIETVQTQVARSDLRPHLSAAWDLGWTVLALLSPLVLFSLLWVIQFASSGLPLYKKSDFHYDGSRCLVCLLWFGTLISTNFPKIGFFAYLNRLLILFFLFVFVFVDQILEPGEVGKAQSPTRTPPSTPIRVEEGRFYERPLKHTSLFGNRGVPQGWIFGSFSFLSVLNRLIFNNR